MNMSQKTPDYTIIGGSGKLTISRIQVNKDGIRPPH